MIPKLAHPAIFAAALTLAVVALPARAHHGTASVGGLSVEGPGSALDTASPLPLGRGTAFVLVKTERASFQQKEGFQEQKHYSSFNTLAAGYGVLPWLSVFVFQPYNWKSQYGVGTNKGMGDTNFMLSGSFKWDEGLKSTPEKESLDELADWHFGLWVSMSIPVGSTTHRDDAGRYFAPDMQTGFRGPSPAVGLSAMKQLGPAFTFLAEVNYQHFFEQMYSEAGYHYKFGGETRLNGALACRAWGAGSNRIDLVPELSILNLQRDRTDEGTGSMEAMEASGGTILYGQIGARATLGSFSLGLSVKRAIATSLNEGADQQGGEGLESYRAALVLGYSTRF